ncbi:acyloxyacyl hydrolase [Candidatus Pelagibacter sp.]|nr:acyloxyacyl hydrolase [Candidatus Pelagibacter sp.]
MKNYNLIKKFFLLFIFIFLILPAGADEKKKTSKNTEFNIYTGMFDFSDNGKRSQLVGFQHQNEELNRNTFLGNLSPITGAMITGDNATYVYTGVQSHYQIGKINLTPSFTPGLYGAGEGKDLGHILEFKSEVQVSLDLSTNSELGLSYNHISNASLGDKNPGANSYMFNFLKKF